MCYKIALIYSLTVFLLAPLRASEVKSVVEPQFHRSCSEVKKPVFYVIEKGDHLSDIIRTFGFKPLYGKSSRVSQVSSMNEIIDPDYIFPGQVVYLPFNCEEDTASYVLVEREKDRMIDANHLIKVKTIMRQNGQRITLMILPNHSTIAFKRDEIPEPDQGNRATQGILLHSPVSSSIARDKVPHALIVRTPSSSANSSSEVLQLTEGQVLALDQRIVNTSHLAHSVFAASISYGFYRIDSKAIEDNAMAVLLSRPALGLAFDWQLNWSPRLSTSLNFALRSLEMKRASIGSLSGGEQTTSGMGINFQYNWTKKFKSVFGTSYEERLFARSIQNGVALLEVYQQPRFDLSFEHELAQSGSLGFDLMLGYRQLLETSTESAKIYNSGEYVMGAKFRQQLEKIQIELKFNYLRGQQKTNLTVQENTAIEAQIGVKLEVGP